MKRKQLVGLDDRNCLSASSDPYYDCIGNPFPTQRTSTSGHSVSSHTKPHHEILVVVDDWYGYKRVGSGSQKASQIC